MAIIEICDICKKQVEIKNGVTVTVSDMNGLDFIGIEPIRCKRKYKVRICDKCVDNIKDYCKNNRDINY